VTGLRGKINGGCSLKRLRWVMRTIVCSGYKSGQNPDAESSSFSEFFWFEKKSIELSKSLGHRQLRKKGIQTFFDGEVTFVSFMI
jgi:hypothetical protein